MGLVSLASHAREGPSGVRRLRRGLELLARPFYPRRCPVCGRFARAFRPFGIQKRPDAQCPSCGALERHRLLWLFLERRTDLFSGARQRLLHLAPERQLAPRLRRVPTIDYVSGDLSSPLAAIRLDLTKLPFATGTFDAILCCHVLEHIPDDLAAMREIRRVLAPAGWAVLQVPIQGATTLEDPAVTDPEERLRLFGQRDHVRFYGRDFADRLRLSGFCVEPTLYSSQLSPYDVRLYGLKRQLIYPCHAPDSS